MTITEGKHRTNIAGEWKKDDTLFCPNTRRAATIIEIKDEMVSFIIDECKDKKDPINEVHIHYLKHLGWFSVTELKRAAGRA